MIDENHKKELCIVHIGMPKTGSSALQDSLFNSIMDSNVSYADLSIANHSAIMFSLFATNPQTHSVHQGHKSTQEDIEKFNSKHRELLIKSFVDLRTNIEIISGEDIFHIDEIGLHRMKEFLNNYFHKVIIVGYTRAPKSFMESAFQQLVKNHYIDSLNFKIIYPHYRAKLEKFDTVFGRENVNLWKFDPKSFPESDITLDFCKRLNIKADSSQALRSNDSISEEAISLLFLNHKFGNKENYGKIEMKLNNILVKTISQIGKSKFKFSKKLTDTILKEYENDIKWIEERMSVSLEEKYKQLETDIDSENDLLVFSQETVNELKKTIGKNYLPQEDGDRSVEYMSKLMDILKAKLAEEYFSEDMKDIKSNQYSISKAQERKEYNLIENFDINWSSYFSINKIEDRYSEPIIHYIHNWRKRNLVVADLFDTNFYLEKYSDIKKANINPLIHYFLHGKKEGRKGIETK